MSFYINSNLSPLEAVRQHEELQVHPVIEEWAQAAEDLESYLEGLDDIIDDPKMDSAKKVKDAILDLMFNQIGRPKN